jgi:hypothetical protein
MRRRRAPLRDAAARACRLSMRTRLQMTVVHGGEAVEFSGDAIATPRRAGSWAHGRYAVGREHLGVELVALGDEGWFRMPAFDTRLPPGKLWVRSPGQWAAPRLVTPMRPITLLAGIEDVEVVSRSADLAGRAVTHYVGRVPDEPDGFVVQAWVANDTRLPLRIHAPRAGGTGPWGFTVDVVEYGVEFLIKPPSARRVIELDAFDACVR